MSTSRRCRFYRDSQSLSLGMGLGYCDFDCATTLCEGEFAYCEKPEALRKYLEEKKSAPGQGGSASVPSSQSGS